MSSRATILLIEDDSDIQEALVEALQMEGYDVVAVADGAQGLRCLSENPAPDLILLDLMMPVMDGWEFLDNLAVSSAPSTPVIVLTASQASAPRGASALVRKPFALDHLLSVVAGYLTPPGRALSPSDMATVSGV